MMNNTHAPAVETAAREFILSRTFNATPNQVYKAWTETDSLEQWWGPAGMDLKVLSLTLKPDGLFHYSMEMPNGDIMWGRFIYKTIEAPNRLEYINSFSDGAASISRAPFHPDWPLEIFNTLMLEEEHGKTKLTLKAYPANATEEEKAVFEDNLENLRIGFTSTLDQLEVFLSNQLVKF